MKRCRTFGPSLVLAVASIGCCAPALALESQSPPVLVAVEAPAPVAAPGTQAGPAIDPALRALLIGVAAAVLRDAAASPDPMSGLGNSLERTFTSLLRSPETMRLVAGLVGLAVKDAPEELREPLAQFALGVAGSLRRELLREGVQGR